MRPEKLTAVSSLLCAVTLALCGAPRIAAAQTPPSPRGTLDALARPRASHIVHYASTDPRGRNGDFRRLAPGDTLTLVDHQGPGVVRRWWVTIAPRNSVAIQRQLIVRCWWDDEATPSVEVPVTDFFGVGFGQWREFQSLPLNMTSGGYNSYWPMPFARHARITVENRSADTVGAFYYNVDVEALDRPPTDTALYFHAQFRRVTTVRGVPVTVLDAVGRGSYVGTVLAMQPRRSRAMFFLEGNEQVVVDGDSAHAIVGTGTEDYFSSGWYFDTGPYSAAYHGAPIKDTTSGRVSAYRWHIEDAIPFRRSLRFAIQHGGANDAPGTDYSSVAFWYQTHPHAPFPPLPADLLPAAPWTPTRIAGMIEAEGLMPTARVTAGELQVQDLSFEQDDSTTWSDGRHLWWIFAKPGARLTLQLPAPAAGSYELVGYFTRATDYGDVRLSANGAPLSPIVRGYSPTVRPTGPVSFGRVRLRAGANPVVVEIVGKDPRSEGKGGGYFVGIDGFVLRR
ncbi:MAG TPA: DUF2961 domain-containing protein [Gemmatimonadaceae bacterium]|nr:DUF2961 domain-containing protein [Gemmatimonadaceae bacterium]